MINLRTDLALIALLLQGITAWRNHTPLPISHLATQYCAIIHNQDKIGWQQIFNGQLASSWAHTQQAYTRHSKTHDQQWGKQIITAIWTQWENLWTLQNKAQHGKDTVSQIRIKQRQALVELQQIYKNKQLYLPLDLHYLQQSYNTHTTKQTYILKNWLNFYRGVFKRSIKEAKLLSPVLLIHYITNNTLQAACKLYINFPTARCNQVIS